MKIAHLADLHLGFRQYHRATARGVNQREADVALAFRNAIDDVIRASPDIVLIAGDVFHSVRPSNPAILDAFNQFTRLRRGLPGVPVVIAAGNHDTPRSAETGSILRLFEAIEGVSVATADPRQLDFADLDLSVLVAPHSAVVSPDRLRFRPDGSRAFQVLLVHGEVAGVVPGDRSFREEAGALVQVEELAADSWSYVALGHYHVAHPVARNAWYPGSLEYVSSNPWGELAEEAAGGRPGKGWLLVELGDRLRVEFQPLALARRHVDLEPIHAAGLSSAELDQEIFARVDAVPGGIAGQIVRQVVYDVPRAVVRGLNHASLRDIKARALHYNLDARRPEIRREVGVGSPGRRMTVPEIVVDYLERRDLESDVNREALIALARRLLEQTESGSAGGDGVT